MRYSSHIAPLMGSQGSRWGRAVACCWGGTRWRAGSEHGPPHNDHAWPCSCVPRASRLGLPWAPSLASLTVADPHRGKPSTRVD